MALDIIYETIILLLSDGRYLHLSSWGKTDKSDNKTHTEFTGRIYTKDDLIKIAKSYMENSKPYVESGKVDLIIINRCASFYEYGLHILRMIKRAKSYDYFINHRHIRIVCNKSVQIVKPEKIIVDYLSLDPMLEKYMYLGDKVAYSYIIEEVDPHNEDMVIRLIDQKYNLKIIIGKVNHTSDDYLQ